MRIKYVLAIMMILLIFIFPQKVGATQHSNVHYLVLKENDKLYWQYLAVPVEEELTVAQKAETIFNEMFKNEQIQFVPEGTRLINCNWQDGILTVNVSKEFLNYGGCFYERCLKAQILKTALDIEGVEQVTLLVENKLEYLPEGSLLKEESSWKDLTEEPLTLYVR